MSFFSQIFKRRLRKKDECPFTKKRKLIETIAIMPAILALFLVINIFGLVVLVPLKGALPAYEIKFEFGLIVLLALVGIVEPKTLLFVAFFAPIIEFIGHGHNPLMVLIEMFYFLFFIGGTMIGFRWFGVVSGKPKEWKNALFGLLTFVFGVMLNALFLLVLVSIGGGASFSFWQVEYLLILGLNALKLAIVVAFTMLIRRKHDSKKIRSWGR